MNKKNDKTSMGVEKINLLLDSNSANPIEFLKLRKVPTTSSFTQKTTVSFEWLFDGNDLCI